MNKWKSIRISKELLGVFFFAFGFIYMLFSVFLNESFVSDHIAGYDDYYEWPDFVYHVISGRIVLYPIAVIGFFLNKIGISKFENQFVLQLVIIFLLACAVCALYLIFRDFFTEKKEKIVLPALLVIAFGNSFFGETFVYIGYELAIGILLAIGAVKLFASKRYVMSAVCVLCSCCVYQSYIAIFMIYTCLYLYLDSEGKFEYKIIWEYLKIALVAASAAVVNIVRAKIPVFIGIAEREVKQVNASISLTQRMSNVLDAYRHTVITACGFYPENFLLCLLLILFGCIVGFIWWKRKKGLDVLYFSFLFVVLNLCYVAIFAIASDAWAAQRVVWPVFCCISSLFIIGLYYFKKTKWKKILTGIFICFMGVNIYYTQTAVMDFYISNKVEVQLVESIEKEIRNYEARTGNVVTTVSARVMPGARYYSKYLNLEYKTITYNHKTLYDEWSNVELLSVFAGRTYNKKRMSDEIFEKYFKDVEYDVYIPSEQLVFEGNTVYWLIF